MKDGKGTTPVDKKRRKSDTKRNDPKRQIHDGVIEGVVPGGIFHTCEVCGKSTLCVEIHKIELPDGIEPTTSLIPYINDEDVDGYHTIRFLGIGCGDYAKFHRQLAHIADKTRRRSA